MSCSEIRSLLPLRPLGALEEDEEKLLAQHAASCAGCRGELEELERALAVLKEPVACVTGPRPGAREDVWAKIGLELDAHPEPVTETPGVELSIALVCSFCKGVLARREACYCASCLAPHHDECWTLHGRCSALGCDETRTVRPDGAVPQVARPRRLRRFGLPIVLLAAGGAAGAVAARRPAPPVAPVGIAKAPTDAHTDSGSETTPPPADETGKDIRRFLEGKEPEKPSEPSTDKAGVIRITDAPEVALLDTATAWRTPIDVTVEEADLVEVVAAIGSRVGRPIIVEPGIHEKVTITLRKISAREALSVIARMNKCDVETLGGETLLLTQPPKVTIQLHQVNVRTVLQLLAAYCGANILISPECLGAQLSVDLHETRWLEALSSILKTFHCHAVAQGEIIVVLPGDGPDLPASFLWKVRQEEDPAPESGKAARLDVDLEDADLREVMDVIGRRVGHNIIVDPDVKEKVSLHVRGIPWHDALVALARLTKCEVEKRQSIYVLSQPPRVTLQATDAPAATFFQLLATYAGRSNVIAAPDVQGAITCDLRGVNWLDAIKATALAGGYQVAEDPGDILRIQMPKRGK